MSRRVLSLAVLVFLFFSSVHFSLAKEQPAPPRIKANKLLELRKHVGQPITAFGKVDRTNTSRSGNHFLNMEGKVLTVICFPDDVKKFTKGKPADTYKNKTIEVTGKLTEYKGKLQLKLTSPNNIKQIDTPIATNGSKSNLTKRLGGKLNTVTLKETSKGVFTSPAGLVYKGRDPKGLSRVDHVRRHMRDMPTRAGSHGVFEGPEGVAWAVIDEAWKIAQKKKIKPNVQRDRATITVSMGRVIGYLGGQNGAKRDYPELSKVFIVYEHKTKNVITAFPK